MGVRSLEKEKEQKGHPIEGLMKTAMESIKQMVDVNTVVGDAVKTDDGTVIIPISQVACGFAAGGAEYDFHNSRNTEMPFGGGSGAGVSVKPIGFLVCKINDVRLISAHGNHLAERIVDLAPQIIDKIEYMLQGLGQRNAAESDINP
jgi:sporulation protein YtfJ